MVRCIAVLVAAAVASVGWSQSCLAQPESEPACKPAESELSKLIKDGKLYEFRFTIQDGKKTTCPTLISPKSCHFAVDSTVEAPQDVVLPPSQECTVDVLSRVGQKLRLKIELQRTVGLEVTDSTAVWSSQHFQELKEITLGDEVTLHIPANANPSAGPINLTIAVRLADTAISKLTNVR